jgi:hypothetical protein
MLLHAGRRHRAARRTIEQPERFPGEASQMLAESLHYERTLRMWIESTLGAGSTLFVSIPR